MTSIYTPNFDLWGRKKTCSSLIFFDFEVLYSNWRARRVDLKNGSPERQKCQAQFWKIIESQNLLVSTRGRREWGPGWIPSTGQGKYLGTDEYRANFESRVPLSNGYQPEKNFWVPRYTDEYRVAARKKFCVSMGNGQKKIMGTGYRRNFQLCQPLVSTTWVFFKGSVTRDLTVGSKCAPKWSRFS